MVYLDSFVVVIKKKNLSSYRRVARDAAKCWKRHGALEYVECVGDDLFPDSKGMPILTFPKLTNLRKDELVLFSYIVYKNKRHRNVVNKKAMSDPQMLDSCNDNNMPFDPKKMAWGGFKSFVRS